MLADWLDLPLKNLSETVEARKLVRDRHARETIERGPFMANRSFQVLRTIHNHARKGLDDNLRDMPPTALVNFNEEPRYVVDDPDVVPKFWSTLDKIDNPVKRSFFAVLLLAGARQGDIKGLRWRNVYRAVAKSLHVDDVHLKLLVNHKLTDVTHGYAGQRSILLETLIAEQEQISRHLM